MKTKETGLVLQYKHLWVLPSLLLALGLVLQPPPELFEGFYQIIVSKNILLTDFIALGGLGATFINSALVGALSLFMLKKAEAPLNGLTVASFLTVMGFAFIGKNVVNTLPIYLGGYLYYKFSKEPMASIIIPLLFSTTLAPLVSEIVFGFPLPLIISIPLAVFCGALIGFVIVPIGRQVSKLHEGFNLYNIGFAGGVIATLFASIFRSLGLPMATVMVLSEEYHWFLFVFLLVFFLALLVIGILFSGAFLKPYWSLLKESGQSPSDFLEQYPNSLVLINMSLMGLLTTGYVLLARGTFNGPVIAGIFTVVGFSAFGKHPKNCIPILLGVFLTSHLKFNLWTPSSTSVIIAALFGTTLAPIAGAFGTVAGVLAGAFHLSMVSNLLSSHGGLNLYNNGFSGGFIAAIMLPLCTLLQKKRRKAEPSALEPKA